MNTKEERKDMKDMKVKTEFYVNEKKRTIACVIFTKNEVIDRLRRYGIYDYYTIDLSEECEYVGIAKCAPEDVWDENYGRKLAEYRAMERRRKDVNRKINTYLEFARKRLDNLNSYGKIKTSRPPQMPEVTKA